MQEIIRIPSISHFKATLSDFDSKDDKMFIRGSKRGLERKYGGRGDSRGLRGVLRGEHFTFEGLGRFEGVLWAEVRSSLSYSFN